MYVFTHTMKEGSKVPRKGFIAKREILPDPIYNSVVVTKLINNIMLDGKKGVAQKIVYGAFERIADKSEKPAIEVFEEAMNNIMPVLEVIIAAFFMQNCNFSDKFVSKTRLKILILSAGMDACHQFTLS